MKINHFCQNKHTHKHTNKRVINGKKGREITHTHTHTIAWLLYHFILSIFMFTHTDTHIHISIYITRASLKSIPPQRQKSHTHIHPYQHTHPRHHPSIHPWDHPTLGVGICVCVCVLPCAASDFFARLVLKEEEEELVEGVGTIKMIKRDEI